MLTGLLFGLRTDLLVSELTAFNKRIWFVSVNGSRNFMIEEGELLYLDNISQSDDLNTVNKHQIFHPSFLAKKCCWECEGGEGMECCCNCDPYMMHDEDRGCV
jgi:hypothetical protein